MRKLVTVLALVWGIAGAQAAERGPAVKDYPADQVAAHTYVIHGPVGYPSPENQGFMMKPEVAKRLARFQGWPGFEDEPGKHISLAYLEVEGGQMK